MQKERKKPEAKTGQMRTKPTKQKARREREKFGAMLVCLPFSFCLETLAFFRFISIPYLRSFLGLFLLRRKN